jgi:hypothetical protein
MTDDEDMERPEQTAPYRVRREVVVDRIRGVRTDKNQATVDEGFKNRGENVYPKNLSELNRDVTVGSHADFGRVFGRKITVVEGSASELTRVGSAVGLEGIFVKSWSGVIGPLLSAGSVTIGDHAVIYGDIVGKEVTLGEDCTVKGNILSEEDINAGKDLRVFGIIFSRFGGVGMADDSIAFDIIAKEDIVLGEKCLILDNVLWSTDGEISAIKAKLGVIVDPEVVDSRRSLYDSVQGLESSRIPAGSKEYGSELNCGWVTVKDDLSARNQRMELLKSQWKALVDLSTEYL